MRMRISKGSPRPVAEFVAVDVTGDGVATIRVDRAPLNLLSFAVRFELAAALESVASDPSVRSVILYGGDKVFSAGDDVRELRGLDAEQARRVANSVRELFTGIATLPKPVVAAISGYAIGSGLGLSLCADWRIIGDNVKLAFDEVFHGGIPLGGTLARSSELIGGSKTRELVFSGRFVEPDESKVLGLADEVVAPDEVYNAAMAWAKRMAQGPAAAIGSAKRVLTSTAADTEDIEFAELCVSAERSALLEAFIERGPAASGG